MILSFEKCMELCYGTKTLLQCIQNRLTTLQRVVSKEITLQGSEKSDLRVLSLFIGGFKENLLSLIHS